MGVKRKLERDRLRAEGRLKHRGKKKCRICGQWGCKCNVDKSLSQLDAITEMQMLENALVPLTVILAAKYRRKKNGDEPCQAE